MGRTAHVPLLDKVFPGLDVAPLYDLVRRLEESNFHRHKEKGTIEFFVRYPPRLRGPHRNLCEP